ncbi:MAG TPA: SUMF1/EgtB/PvdO family nonheme iron enzyme [Polyangiaceae bacterium]
MNAGSRAFIAASSLTAAALVQGCPVDDRTLHLGSGGTIVITTGGNPGGGAAGMAGEESGGTSPGTGGLGGSSAGSIGDGGDSGTGGTSGTGTGGSGGLVECRTARCSCFGDEGDECASENCCGTGSLPAGSFTLGGGGGTSVDATLETYGLDDFEVTVGRFRKFVASYLGPPSPEDGQNPWVVGSGWQSAWNGSIAADADALRSELRCDTALATWTNEPGDHEASPMNCVTWFEAFAFCAWDGARVPSEAEWEYAASGADSPSDFPWGDQAPDHDRALYDCDGRALDDCTADDFAEVGSKPEGYGRFGHADLAGSVAEWVLDWHAAYADPCENCANVEEGTERVTRGGSLLTTTPSDLSPRQRSPEAPDLRSPAIGIRCARDD